jgi:hypothetical protein
MAVRSAVLATLMLAACGAPAGTTTPTGSANRAADGVPVVRGFDATRWIPNQPTFALAAHSIRDLQRSARSVVGTLGLPFNLDELAVSQMSNFVFGLDLLSPEAVEGIGIDPSGGVAVFSEGITPTFVVHLSSPPKFTAWMQHEMSGLGAPVATAVDGITVTSVGTPNTVSWAIDPATGWAWVHSSLQDASDPPTWFAHSHGGGGGGAPDWDRVTAHGKPSVIAFTNTHALFGAAIKAMPGDIGTCIRQLDTLGNFDVGIDVDERSVAAHFSFDVGTGMAGLRASLLAPPPGWAQASANAPVALAWNVDLSALAAWLKPCMRGDDHFAMLDSYGVRSGRAVILGYKSETEFSGAVSLDLSNAKFLTDQLDQIPLRKHLESDRTFGVYKGHHLSIPALFAIDYVLQPTVAIIARGDGLLERVAGQGPPTPPSTVFGLDLLTTAMTDAQWHALGDLVHLDASEIQHVLFWKTVHVGAHVDGNALVIDLSAERR